MVPKNNYVTFGALKFYFYAGQQDLQYIYFSFLIIYKVLEVNPFNPESFCTDFGGLHNLF